MKNTLTLKNQLKREFGFTLFAWLPTKLTNGKYTWLTNVFYAGRKFGCENRYAKNGSKVYELRYPAIKLQKQND
jgi:hypothetical protein